VAQQQQKVPINGGKRAKKAALLTDRQGEREGEREGVERFSIYLPCDLPNLTREAKSPTNHSLGK
jgi:hypothetical protein